MTLSEYSDDSLAKDFEEYFQSKSTTVNSLCQKLDQILDNDEISLSSLEISDSEFAEKENEKDEAKAEKSLKISKVQSILPQKIISKKSQRSQKSQISNKINFTKPIISQNKFVDDSVTFSDDISLPLEINIDTSHVSLSSESDESESWSRPKSRPFRRRVKSNRTPSPEKTELKSKFTTEETISTTPSPKPKSKRILQKPPPPKPNFFNDYADLSINENDSNCSSDESEIPTQNEILNQSDLDFVNDNKNDVSVCDYVDMMKREKQLGFCNMTQYDISESHSQINRKIMNKHKDRIRSVKGYDSRIDTSDDHDSENDKFENEEVRLSDEEFINDKSVLKTVVVEKYWLVGVGELGVSVETFFVGSAVEGA